MLTNAIGHVTDEQGINSAMMLCGEGAHGAYSLAKWGVRHAWKTRKTARTAADDRLVSDACSAYRGGYTSADDPEIGTLLRDLSGSPDFPETAGKPFFWTGERDDLSWFWKKTERDTPVILKRETVDGIADEAVRARVRSVMEQARLEGLLNKIGDSYLLTDAGRKAVLNPEFIRRRLNRECGLYAAAYGNLDSARKEAENDRIDRRLEELGRAGEFEGCDRVTLNKRKLLADDTAEDVVRFYIPGTARSRTADLPKSDVIELDGGTYAAFLRKNQTYPVNGEPIPEAELFAQFESKNKAERIKAAADRGERDAAAEIGAGYAGYGDPDEFFEAALKAGMKLDGPAPERRERPLAGSRVSVILPEGPDREAEVAEYTVARTIDTREGTHFYLTPEDPARGDLLLPEDARGHLLFDTRDAALAHAAESPEDVRSYARLLEAQTAPVRETRLIVLPSHFEQTKNGFLVHPKDAPFEAIRLDAQDVELQQDGSASIRLRPDRNYTVASGPVSYTVSGDGAQRLLKGAAKPLSAEKAAAGLASGDAEALVEAAAKTIPGAKIAAKIGGLSRKL